VKGAKERSVGMNAGVALVVLRLVIRYAKDIA
jgi:hypothetical protein